MSPVYPVVYNTNVPAKYNSLQMVYPVVYDTNLLPLFAQSLPPFILYPPIMPSPSSFLPLDIPPFDDEDENDNNMIYTNLLHMRKMVIQEARMTRQSTATITDMRWR